MRDLQVGDKLDQFALTEVLSRTGMATVFKATDEASGHPVVLKVPNAACESDIVFFQRFEREQEIGERVSHPNVVRVLNPGEKSRVYIAMEFLEGESLRERLNTKGPLTQELAISIALQVGSALSHLHEHGVVHRDVKPENVFILPNGGEIKLLDFGIALLESARRLTWSGLSNVLGTPDYMAPEQIRGRRGDTRTDVYALGTLLYEMLSGHLPFEAPDSYSLMHAKTHGAPRRLREVCPEVSPEIDAIVMKAIARDPRDRYACVDTFSVDLLDPHAAALILRSEVETLKRRSTWIHQLGAAPARLATAVRTFMGANASRRGQTTTTPARSS